MSDLVDRAERTLAQHLSGNPYPGRGLVLGRSADGDAWLQLYWIMGRSPNSRNRVFVADDTTLCTELFDAAAVEDPSLILYDAMLEWERAYLVSNGDQTDTDLDGCGNACDADYDNNGKVGSSDFTRLRNCFNLFATATSVNGPCAPVDANNDGKIGAVDFTTLRNSFNLKPGISLSPLRKPALCRAQ